MTLLTRRWGLEQCRQYFQLGDAEEAWIRGPEGSKHLMALYEDDPDGFDEHPLTLLRQEWWHAYAATYTHPGFWAAIAPGSVVVDYGCGVGAVTLPWLVRQQGTTVLVDTSAAVRAYVQAKFQPWGAVLVQSVDAFFVHQPCLYDALVCVDVLEHLPNPMAVQQALWDRLRPGGHALLKLETVWPHPGHRYEAVTQFPAWKAWIEAHTEIIEIETYAWVRKPQ